MTDSFSTPDTHAFEHPELSALAANAEAGPSSLSNGTAVADLSIEEAFEVDDTVQRILDGGYKTIGLQFPDELLPCSVPVFRAIQSRIQGSGAQAYVLADSTYGSCCPDVLSCLHLPAHFLVHYGHACLTPTDALPVHYVFPRQALDVEHALRSLSDASRGDLMAQGGSDGEGRRKGIIVVWDVAYDWTAEELVRAFTQEDAYPMSFATIQRLVTPTPTAAAATAQNSDKAPSLRSISPPPGLEMRDCVIWYIGEEGRGMTNLQMQHADASIYAYSPTSRSAQPLSSSRHLQRRLLSIHHAVSSSIFGLVVHSVGLHSAQPLLAELRQLLRAKKKKSYTLTVGRLNPAKLANFETVECFVLVGCQEGGLVDSKDFLRPIVTPWELVLALQGPEHLWEPGKWTLDMSKVLGEAKLARSTQTAGQLSGNGERDEGDEAKDRADNDDGDDGPVFSLVDGTYKSRKVFGSRRKPGLQGNGTGTGVKGAEDGIRDLTVRNKEFSLARLESAGSHYLSSRHFQGLEVRYGEDEPAQLEEGRSGIARGYTEER